MKPEELPHKTAVQDNLLSQHKDATTADPWSNAVKDAYSFVTATSKKVEPLMHTGSVFFASAGEEIVKHPDQLVRDAAIGCAVVMGTEALGITTAGALALAAIPLAGIGIVKGIEVAKTHGIAAVPKYFENSGRQFIDTTSKIVQAELDPKHHSAKEKASADAAVASLGAGAPHLVAAIIGGLQKNAIIGAGKAVLQVGDQAGAVAWRSMLGPKLAFQLETSVPSESLMSTLGSQSLPLAGRLGAGIAASETTLRMSKPQGDGLFGGSGNGIDEIRSSSTKDMPAELAKVLETPPDKSGAWRMGEKPGVWTRPIDIKEAPIPLDKDGMPCGTGWKPLFRNSVNELRKVDGDIVETFKKGHSYSLESKEESFHWDINKQEETYVNKEAQRLLGQHLHEAMFSKAPQPVETVDMDMCEKVMPRNWLPPHRSRNGL